MEITLETNYLTQEEFTVLNQIQINVGVRAELNRMKSSEDPETSSPIKRKAYKKRKKVKTLHRLTPKEIRKISSMRKKGKTVHQMAVETGLKKKTIRGTIYRMENIPSDLMIKVLKL